MCQNQKKTIIVSDTKSNQLNFERLLNRECAGLSERRICDTLDIATFKEAGATTQSLDNLMSLSILCLRQICIHIHNGKNVRHNKQDEERQAAKCLKMVEINIS